VSKQLILVTARRLPFIINLDGDWFCGEGVFNLKLVDKEEGSYNLYTHSSTLQSCAHVCLIIIG
jgi:hypothetical protein